MELPHFAPFDVKVNLKLSIKTKINGKVENVFMNDDTIELVKS